MAGNETLCLPVAGLLLLYLPDLNVKSPLFISANFAASPSISGI